MNLKSLIHKSLLKNTLIYALTDGISKSISFLLLPVLSYYLIPDELGVVANFNVLQSIIMLISGQAIVNSLPYFYYKASHRDIALLVSSLLLIILIVNLVFSFIILLFNSIVQEYLQITFSLQILTIITVISNLLIAINMVLFRLEEKPYQFAKLQLIQTGFNITLVVILVIMWHWGAEGKIYATVISTAIMAVVHLYLLIKRKYIILIFDTASLKTLLKFGLPLLPHSLSFWIKSGTDKILLTTFCGLATNGIYSMAMSFGAIFSIFHTAFNNAYVPYLQKKLSNINPSTKYKEEMSIVSLTYKVAGCFSFLCVLATGICWVVIYYLLSDKYKLSFEFIPWIMLSLTLTSFYTLFVVFVYSKKKTIGLGIITFSGSICQLLMTYFFILLWGKDGIKYSMVLGSFIIMLSVWIYSNKVYPLPWFYFLRNLHNSNNFK